MQKQFKIKYAGPRVFINQYGVFFKKKEDKYHYLIVALEILLSISHDYSQKKSYSSMLQHKTLNEPKIHKILQQYDQDLEIKVLQEEQKYEQHIEDEIEQVKKNQLISDIEKDTWIKNIQMMKEYRIQRAINKIYYMHCIEDIVKIIFKQNIKKITAPFNEQFWHVLHTIQGKIETAKFSKETKLIEKTLDDGTMIVQLDIL